jgi:hypothetical protein
LEYGYAEVEVEDDLVAVFAACPPGKEPIGGGGGVDTPGWFLFLDAPWYDEEEDVAGWLIAAEHVDGEIQEVGAFAVAACALPDPDAAEGSRRSPPRARASCAACRSGTPAPAWTRADASNDGPW